MRIECGKGGKERYVMLSEQLLDILRNYWRLTRLERFPFPGHNAGQADRAHRSACGLPVGARRGWRR